MDNPAIQNDVLLYWRKKIYQALSKSFVILGGIAYVPSMILSVHEKIWPVAILDTIVYSGILYVFFAKAIPFYTKVYILNSILYILGLCLLVFLGPVGAGWIWLFIFPVISTILSGFKSSIITICISAATLIVLGFLLQRGYLNDYLISKYNFESWLIVSINFICLELMVCLPIAVLVRGLEASLLQEKKSQKLIQAKQEELAQHNKELIKINEDMDNFIYTASHDLKSPLTNIEGLVNFLNTSTEENNKEDIKIVLPLINKSVEKFKRILIDLAEIGKVQREISEHHTESVHVKDMLDEIIYSMDPAYKKKDYVIKTAFEVEDIKFSRKNLRSILYNLISNALKYSSPARDAEITVTIQRRYDMIVLSVQDNGLGMSAGDESKIFKMFKRVHDHVEGSGVGLYIVKRIVDNNEGKIEVDTTLGRGTVFTIYLHENK